MKKRVFGILASLVAILLSVPALASVFAFTAERGALSALARRG